MNYWTLGSKSVATYSTYLTPVDGDLGKVTMVDESIDIGTRPMRRAEFMLSGRRVKTEFLPTQLSADGPLNAIDDLNMVMNRYSASEAFKKTVEEIAPDAIQLEAFEVFDGKQANVPDVR